LAKHLKSKIRNKLVAFILLLVFAFVASIFISQTRQLRAETIEISDLDSQIQTATQKNASLTNKINLAVTDKYKEDVAKNRDGLVFPNELIFVDSFATQ